MPFHGKQTNLVKISIIFEHCNSTNCRTVNIPTRMINVNGWSIQASVILLQRKKRLDCKIHALDTKNTSRSQNVSFNKK